jgi:hypothetical protein
VQFEALRREEFFAEKPVTQNLRDFGVQPAHHVARRACRRIQSEPGAEENIETEFLVRRQIRDEIRTLRIDDRQGPDLAAGSCE